MQGDLDPLSNTWFLGPTQVHIPKRILIGSVVLIGLMIVRQTDQQTLATLTVATGRIYVVLQCGPNNNICICIPP